MCSENRKSHDDFQFLQFLNRFVLTLLGLAQKPSGHVPGDLCLFECDRELTASARAMAHACMHGMISDLHKM